MGLQGFFSASLGYPWNSIDHISEYLTDNQPYGGVVMRVGRWLTTVDSRLPNRTAEKVAEALSSFNPN